MDATDSLETLPCIKPHGVASHKVVFVITSCESRQPHILLWSWYNVHNPLAFVDGCRVASFSGHIRATCSRFLTEECYTLKLEAADKRYMRNGNLGMFLWIWLCWCLKIFWEDKFKDLGHISGLTLKVWQDVINFYRCKVKNNFQKHDKNTVCI